MKELQELKKELQDKINTIDERIKRISGPSFYDQTKRIENLHGEAFTYEKVIAMIDKKIEKIKELEECL